MGCFGGRVFSFAICWQSPNGGTSIYSRNIDSGSPIPSVAGLRQSEHCHFAVDTDIPNGICSLPMTGLSSHTCSIAAFRLFYNVQSDSPPSRIDPKGGPKHPVRRTKSE